MVDKEIVLETIKKMYESGIDDSVVVQTLKDIGLKPNEIQQYIDEVKGVSPAAEPVPEPKPLEARMAAAEEKVDHGALHTTTHVALEEQSAKTTELLEKIESLESKLAVKGKGPSSDQIATNQRLGTIEKKVSDIKAEVEATRSIMEKILETDRKVLNKL